MKKRNMFMSTTIMCGLFIVAFKFNHDQITWLWTNYQAIPIILGVIAIALGTQWMKHQRLLNRAKQN